MTWARASQELQISGSKLTHLLKIVNTLPQDFIEAMKSYQDQDKLKIFNGKRLLRISRLKTEKERRSALERLLPRGPKHIYPFGALSMPLSPHSYPLVRIAN
jgi:hypothetical protein